MRPTAPLVEPAAACSANLRDIAPWQVGGRVIGLSGLVIDIDGLAGHVAVGDHLLLERRDGGGIPAEIVGFRQGLAQAMPFSALDGLGPGSAALFRCGPAGGSSGGTLPVANSWLGRVLDPLGRPLDGHGPLPVGPCARRVRAAPPDATQRARLGPRLDLGVRALNCFATCRQGQRMGLFSGSGIGKSSLLAMLARHTACDVAVLALVGERGREVREFLEDDLGEAGLQHAVVVVATSDSPPLLRRQAAFAAMTVAEHFRDQGKSVLLLMDSITRFCLALREIGLSAGEPPATRGYPPSVFAELPRLLERAGPGLQQPDGSAGQITALFSVLVEGDDQTSLWRTPCAASLMAMSCWIAGSPKPAATLRSTSCGHYRVRSQAVMRRRRTRWRVAHGPCWRCMPIWPTWCASARMPPAAIQPWTRQSHWRRGSRRCWGRRATNIPTSTVVSRRCGPHWSRHEA